MKNSIFHGVHTLQRGLQGLKQPGLRAFVLWPLIINSLLFSLLLVGFYWQISHLIHWVNAQLPSWLLWLSAFIWLLFTLALIVVITLCFMSVAIIIAAPFNALLAERVVQLETGIVPASGRDTLLGMLKDVPRVLAREWRKACYWLPRVLAVLLLSLIPGLQLITIGIWPILNSWLMAVQFMDYPLDNEKRSFEHTLATCRAERLSMLGFGGMVMLLSLIPIVNFFVIPAAVIGASLWWVEYQQSTQ